MLQSCNFTIFSAVKLWFSCIILILTLDLAFGIVYTGRPSLGSCAQENEVGSLRKWFLEKSL